MRRYLSIRAQARLNAKPSNQVIRVVDGIKHRRLGSSDIIVSELGLGTQRWCGADFNSPDEDLVHQFLDRAILGSGVNLIDTAGECALCLI
jgi:hypothetical protein